MIEPASLPLPLRLLSLPLLGTPDSYKEAPGVAVTVRRRAAHTLPDNEFQNGLRRRVRQLPVSAYEHLVAELLQAVGYEQVRVLREPKLRDPERPRRSHKGRTTHGGVDLIAQGRSGLMTDAVLVQVKQYERPVSRRFVDELRGALLRTESRHALLITTSRFSPAAVKAAQEDHVAPIHLMDGERLCQLLCEHRIGVRRDRKGRLRVDRRFFRPLNKGEAPEGRHPAERCSSFAGKQSQPRLQAKSSAPAQGTAEKGGGMMGRTHVLTGIATLWLLELPGAITQETVAPLVLFAAAGALFPDLDAGDSMIRRLSVAGIAPMAPLSQVLHHSFGHRGLLHSFLGLGLFTALCALPVAVSVGWPPGAALTLGYASHVLADAATKSGVPLLYPRRQRYHLLPKGWRLTTGSLAEEALLPLLALCVVALLFAHVPFAA